MAGRKREGAFGPATAIDNRTLSRTAHENIDHVHEGLVELTRWLRAREDELGVVVEEGSAEWLSTSLRLRKIAELVDAGVGAAMSLLPIATDLNDASNCAREASACLQRGDFGAALFTSLFAQRAIARAAGRALGLQLFREREAVTTKSSNAGKARHSKDPKQKFKVTVRSLCVDRLKNPEKYPIKRAPFAAMVCAKQDDLEPNHPERVALRTVEGWIKEFELEGNHSQPG